MLLIFVFFLMFYSCEKFFVLQGSTLSKIIESVDAPYRSAALTESSIRVQEAVKVYVDDLYRGQPSPQDVNDLVNFAIYCDTLVHTNDTHYKILNMIHERGYIAHTEERIFLPFLLQLTNITEKVHRKLIDVFLPKIPIHQLPGGVGLSLLGVTIMETRISYYVSPFNMTTQFNNRSEEAYVSDQVNMIFCSLEAKFYDSLNQKIKFFREFHNESCRICEKGPRPRTRPSSE